MKRRILSIITALALCLSLCPTWAFATEADPSLCKHHPEHTEDCGYAAPTEGHGCGHQHTAECYTKGVLPDADGGDYYEIGADTENLLDCQHSHDSDCGYVQADPGAPCGYVCRICPIEALIAALPEQVTEDNADDVRAQLDHILDLFTALNEDEQEEINLSRIYALQGALDAANVPDMIEGEVSVTYQEASWSGGVTYTTQTADSCTPVADSAEAVTWDAGWYVVNSTVTIDQPITVTGAVNLILADGCTLDAQKGIVVETGNSLTIYAQSGSGTLNATGTTDSSNNASAGIGGSTSSFDSGTITIHGGAINATGGSTDSIGYGGAGIGGGTPNYGNGGSSGAITIYGGTVTANSGEGGLTGAGIGGGGGEEGGTSSNITIYGGSVTAASIDTSTGGAGIGGGSGFTRGGGDSNIQIHGGTVNATGGYMGAGIGGGADSAGTSGNGTVTISGGTVTAVGGQYAAGIGGGGGYSAKYSSCTGGTGSVTISGGIVDATGGAGNSSGNYAGDPIGNGGNTTATATVNKTTGIVFENGAGTVCGDVTLNGSYEVPAGYSLHIPASASLSGSGTLSGGSAFTTENLTEDMISVPTNLYYNGEDRTEYLTTELSGELTKGVTICGQTFTVSGWTLAVEKAADSDLTYTATYTNDSDNTKTVQKTITLLQSGTKFEGGIKTYNGETETTSFTAGDTITVKATPTPTGDAPQKAAARLRADPTEGQMVVYVGTTQVSVPADKGEDGTYTMEVSAADVLLAAGGPGTGITLTAKFVGNDNMADGAGTVKVNITAVAKAERGGNVIDYFGVSDFEGTNNLFCQEAYADATITLLGDVQPGTNSDAGTTCSTMVNITCTLDLAGHNFTSTDTAIYVLPMGNLTIQDSSTGKTGNVSYIKSDGTLTLYGGTFGKIETAYTLSSLLAENCAYYRGSTPILLSELEGQKTLDGTVTVQECQHTGVEVKDLGSGKHGLDCPYCGYHSEHTTTLTATVSGNTVTFRGGCESCDYRAETLATAAFTIPKLTYGQTDQTVSCTWEHPDGYALMVQIDSGEELQLESSDTQVSLPLKQLFGSQEINAGNYQLHVYCRSYADVTSNVCSLPVTVDPAPLPEVTLSAESATYSGTEQKPALSVKQGETPLTEGTDYEVSYTRDGVVTNDFTSAGTVNITVTGKGNYTGSVEKTYTIGKATPTIAWANNVVTLTYTGQPADIKPVVTLVNGETFSGTITYHHTNTDSSESGESKAGLPTNAGIYVVGAKIPEQDNYTAATTASLMLMINKADQTVPAAPTADEENIKDTSITLDTIENAEYKRDDGEWQDSPVFTDLSPNTPYTFYVRLKEDSNHNASPDSTGASITTKKTMLNNATVTVSGSYTYTGAAIVPEAGNVEVVLNGTKIDSDQYTISASNNIDAGVGKATLTVTATETGNYSGSVSSTFTISKATLYVAPNSQTIHYGESIREGASAILTRGLATGDHVVGVTLTPDTKDVPGGRIIASEVQIQNESGADVTGNYEITYVPGALIINKSQPTIAFADGYNPGKTYDGQTIPNPVEANLTITGATFGDVAFAWSATPKNAGTYTLTASIPVTDNTEAAEAVLTVTISPKAVTPTITITPDSYKYTGSAIHPSGSAVKVMDGDTVIPDSEYTLSYGENTQVGQGSVIVTDKENGNYTIARTTGTFAITKADQAPLTITGAPGSVTYGDTFQLGVSGGSGTGALSWAASGATVDNAGNVTITRAGTVAITAVKEGDSNYVGTEGRIMLDVSKKALTVTGATAQDRQYDGTSAVKITGVTLEGIVNGDTVSVSTANLTGTLNGSNAGSYTAVTLPALSLTGGGADNYTLTRPAGAVSTSVTISKADALTPKTGDLAVANKQAHTYTFGLGALRPDLPAGMSFGSSAVTYTLDAVSLGSYYDSSANSAKIEGQTLTLPIQAVESNEAEGIGTITVTIKSDNFEDITATINVRSVNKTIPTGAPTLSAATLTYGQPLSTITLRGDMAAGATPVPGTFTWSSPDNRPAVQEAYAAAWVFTPTDNNTYAIVNGTSTIKVVPASVAGSVVTLSPTSFRYDGQTHSPTVTSVKLGDTTLTADTDYTVEIPTETAAGTYTVTVTGKGNYTGTAAATFTINPVETGDEFKNESGTTLRLEVETGLSTVPEALKNNAKYDTPAKIEAELRTQVEQVMSNVGENIAVFDVTLQYKDASGTWHNVDPDHFPTEGVTAILPYPAGTGATGYTFTVQHLISSGTQAGTMETLSYTLTADGLQCKFLTLSPVAIGYQAAAKPVDPVNPNPGGGSGGGGGGWSSSTYAVTVERAEHGKVTSNRTNASSGSTVTLTVTPDTGYVLDTLTVTDSRGNAIKLTAQGNGKYTFTMPGRAVTVRAAFAPLPDGTACDGGEGCPSRGFTDLGSVGTWYHEAVDYVLRNTLMGGYGNGLFGPNNTLTRAQFAQILFNKEGRPVVNYLLQFTDVSGEAWYTEAVRWAASQGIVGGYADGRFGPNDNITREQLAVMLWRYAGSPAATDKELHFNDADKVGAYARDAMRWAVENGVISGKGGGILDPKGLATRAQTAQMLKNYLDGQSE